MQAISTSPFNLTMLRRANTWYTVKDGNWSDPAIWLSNGKRKYNTPQPSDTVYIDHNVAIDVSATVCNMYVAGKLTATNATGLNLTLNGDLQSAGTLDFTGSHITLSLNSYNNEIATLIAGNSTIIYNRAGDQIVLGLPYNNLAIYNTGIKYLVVDTVIGGNLNINDYSALDAILECGTNSLTVNGSTSINGANSQSYNFSKSGSGDLLFTGSLNINSNTLFSGNISNIELRGGVSLSSFGGNIIFNCPVLFTTNSQSISGNNIYFNDLITISGALTVTNNSSSLYIMGVLNGDNSSSTFNNNSTLYLASSSPMITGVFNYMNVSSSTIGYIVNGSFTLPYSSYKNLVILGTGTKFLSGNTSVSNLNINNYETSKAQLDCGAYDLTINGNLSVTGTGGVLDAALLKSGSGNIIFVGNATFNTANISFNSDVTLEFRGGVNFSPFGTPIGSVDATINFTTESQTLSGNNVVFNGDIYVSGGITLTTNGGGSGHYYNGIINGGSSSDTLLNAGSISYQNPTAPMMTGILNCSSTNNTFYYSLDANQDIAAGTYKNLTLSIGGSKRLLGNVSVTNTYSLISPSTLNLNGYALTNP
jgi:hypothetical protein